MELPMKLTGIQSHTTVLLSSTYSLIYKPFHCSSCGNIVFSYNENEVRTILPGGTPTLDKPGKIYQCQGVMKLRGTASIYDVLYQVIETALNIDNLEDLHTAMAYIAKDSTLEVNARCKQMYYVS